LYVSSSLRPRRSHQLRSLAIGAAIAVGASLGVLAPAAAAAPANDTLAGRTPLTGALPIEIGESNAGATWEEGEFISPFGFASRHSIWWEWEAPAGEVVSIGSCGSDFTTKIGVFTGDSFPLQPVAGSSGPECDAQRTFDAVAGTRYVIGVDGYSFYIPGGPPPAPGEGTVALKIAALPPPPDDDFAAAIPVRQIVWQLPNDERLMFGTAGGYNWGATSEPGEPVHAGVGGGASAWFSFVAPGTGNVALTSNPSQQGHPILAVYTGSAVSALTPVAASAEPGGLVTFDVEAGQEFHIAVDGPRDGEGATWMGDFDLTLTEKLPPGTGNASGAPELLTSTLLPPGSAKATAPPVPPQATAPPAPPQVKGRSIDARTGTASFHFASATRGAGFRCSLDRAPFRACTSPLRLHHLDPGGHRLGIVTVLGRHLVSAPAVIHFALAPPRRQHHQAG
jgi:hypothetical protein